MPLSPPTRLDASAATVHPHSRRLRGSLRAPLFDAEGRLEGLLLMIGQQTVHIVIAAPAPSVLLRVEPGQFLSLEAEDRADGTLRSLHPGYTLRRVVAIDGRPVEPEQTRPSALRCREPYWAEFHL